MKLMARWLHSGASAKTRVDPAKVEVECKNVTVGTAKADVDAVKVTNGRVTEAEHRILSRLEQIQNQLASLERKVERALLETDVIRKRMSSYLGDNVALTYLADETPIFINSNDSGCPMHLLDGGEYEGENLDVLLSFVTGSTVFLDIGANLGFFALQVAVRLQKSGGKVHAFEPHPKVYGLLNRSVARNHLEHIVEAHNFCLSDRAGTVDLRYPIGHIGGGGVPDREYDEKAYATVRSELKELDNVFGPGFSCDLVKIDVEGHELQVLNGMHRVLQNSPGIKILIEKLFAHAGTEQAMRNLLSKYGLMLYGVGGRAKLQVLSTLSEFQGWQGYVLAARPESIGESPNRRRFSIYPTQLHIVGLTEVETDAAQASVTISGGGVLFYGPYWFLSFGAWRLRIDGEVEGEVGIDVAERGRLAVTQLKFDKSMLQRDFVVDHALVKFECIARALTSTALVRLRRIELIRIG